ncbi:nucleic-acid-binding protein from mobile element jockey [Plakobranchus ocellatus]|uniref:Nucleic-acid-binding protein from mobile element jockey n=1 Tax=Plakobranchus ocellatus TaxID=259542 RepID=A0AAV4BR79_9GAST|nr:nucleic-acid-binding protein from mobile element jockey [Plakobranchus ocellatus]
MRPAAVCVRCGKNGHVERDCSADPHCVNCRGDNATSSKTCSTVLEEQAILRYKAENGGTSQQARKAIVVEIHRTISARTYASAVKTQLRTKPAELPKDSGRSALLPCRRGKKPTHVGIQANENVDKVAKAALNKASTLGNKGPTATFLSRV